MVNRHGWGLWRIWKSTCLLAFVSFPDLGNYDGVGRQRWIRASCLVVVGEHSSWLSQIDKRERKFFVEIQASLSNRCQKSITLGTGSLSNIYIQAKALHTNISSWAPWFFFFLNLLSELNERILKATSKTVWQLSVLYYKKNMKADTDVDTIKWVIISL